jgi:hypothetical protein
MKEALTFGSPAFREEKLPSAKTPLPVVLLLSAVSFLPACR